MVEPVVIERRLEIDTSLGTLDFVARTDWVSVNPGISMLRQAGGSELVVCPLIDPPLMLDLYLIERARNPLTPEARAFLEVLSDETTALGVQAGALLEQRAPGAPRRRR